MSERYRLVCCRKQNTFFEHLDELGRAAALEPLQMANDDQLSFRLRSSQRQIDEIIDVFGRLGTSRQD